MKVRMLKSGKIREVTTNVAFGLVDSGQADYLTGAMPYQDRQMRVEPRVKAPRKFKNTPKKGKKVARTYKTR